TWFGTTEAGGSSNAGTIFTINSNRTSFHLLRAFGSTATDGKVPNGLIEGNDGILYGTTQSGGTAGVGTFFKMGKDGNSYDILHHFGASGDGRLPIGALLEGNDGLLYGCTFSGGASSRACIFKINKDGA